MIIMNAFCKDMQRIRIKQGIESKQQSIRGVNNGK